MRQLTLEHLRELLQGGERPCISLYQPTHRCHPDNQQDPIRYRNLLRHMESSLKEQYPSREVRPLLSRFEPLARNEQFWNHRTEGLAMFCAPQRFEVFELQRPVTELLVVANTFHIKPLIRVLQSADRFQILCLDRHTAALYEGNRYVLDPVELTAVPATITDALGEELTEPHLTVASYGLGAGKGGKEMYHGHGARKDEIDVDLERFFRIVDRGILEHHSRPSGLPLILAALAEYHAPFRALSHNPYLMSEGLAVHPDSLSREDLHRRAWQVVEPVYLRRLNGLVEDYRVARSQSLGSDDLSEIVPAALSGRIGVLLIEADRLIPGRIDPASRRMVAGDLTHPEIDDVLDDLAQTVLKMKGEVVVVPAERMPATTGVAATYRF